MKLPVSLFVLILAASPALSQVLAASAPAASTAPAQAAPTASAPAPTDPLSVLPPAAAAAAQARVRLENARDELADFVRDRRYVFENSPEYRAALADQRTAYQRYTAARDAVLTELRADPAYSQALALRADLARQIEAEHAQPQPNRQRIASLSGYRMIISSKVSSREAEALAADEEVTASKKALLAATTRSEELRRAFDLSLRTGEQLASARQSVRAAHEQKAAALAFDQQARVVAEASLRYAYYIQNLSTYRPTYTPTYGYPVAYTPAYPVATGGIGYGLLPGQ